MTQNNKKWSETCRVGVNQDIGRAGNDVQGERNDTWEKPAAERDLCRSIAGVVTADKDGKVGMGQIMKGHKDTKKNFGFIPRVTGIH